MQDRYKNIPEDLKKLKRWCLWKYGKIRPNGKPEKPPLDKNGINIDKMTFEGHVFDEVSHSDKIGFIMREEDGLVAIDIDKCINEDGSYPGNIKEIIDKFNSYTEISPSGKGFRIFVYGNSDKNYNVNGFELYYDKSYVTITGNKLPESNTKIVENQEAINWYTEKYLLKKNDKLDNKVDILNSESKLEVEVDIERKFEDLFEGNWQKYFKSQSEADLALCSLLYSRYLDLPEDIDTAVKMSGLYRAKWDREDYKIDTIEKAMKTPKSKNKYPIPIFLYDLNEREVFEPYLGNWLTKSSMTMIYGPAGVGKTRFILNMIKSLITGEDLLGWKCHKILKVIYVNGEIPFCNFREKYIKPFNMTNPRFFYVHAVGKNLEHADVKNEIMEYVDSSKSELIIFDNITSLCPDLEEDKTKDWMKINKYFLELREKTSIIFVHHANKGGTDQRGTTSRLANLDNNILLATDKVKDKEFKIKFEKCRFDENIDTSNYLFSVRLKSDNLEIVQNNKTKKDKSKKKNILELHDKGMKQSEIAKIVGVKPQYVSRVIKEASIKISCQ